MFAQVCFHRDLFAAEIIRNLLLENGLHPMRIDYPAHAFFAGAEQGYFIQVPNDEVEAATKILRDNGPEKHVVT